jgi:soluble lytic murein transglycosylase
LAFSICFGASLDSLKKEPSGYAKDLFLLEILKGDISDKEAYEAFFLTKTPKSDHSTLLLKKTASKKLARLFDCMDSNITRALKKTPECAELGVNYKKISNLLMSGSNEPVELSKNISEAAPEKAAKIELLSKVAFERRALDAKSVEIYFETPKEFRAAFFDTQIDDTNIDAILATPNAKRFVKWVLFDANQTKLQKSIAKAKPKSSYQEETLFFMGLTKLKHGEDALKCFKMAAENAKSVDGKDRALFWAYLSSKSQEFLKQISNEGEVNFYSMLAKEALGIKQKNIEFLELDDAKERVLNERNTTSPFYWQRFRAEVKNAGQCELEKLAKAASEQKDAEAYYAYAKEKLNGYKKEYFLLPYKEAFKDFNESQKTLLHAIGKQESLFIPGDVSSAYAIGVMQIIPILAEELAQKRKEKLSFFELFEPSKNISYAATHFKWLESKVGHPTLIAISYNAGYGFFKRIEKEGLFRFDDDAMLAYEPFWSIENIPYDETRNYAKKVSLNYSIYSEKFKEKISLTQLLENLVSLRRK